MSDPFSEARKSAEEMILGAGEQAREEPKAKPADAPGERKADDQAPAPKVAPDDAVVQLKYRGAPIALPVAEVRNLASKGYDYERRMAELSKREKEVAELERDRALIDDFRAFKEYLAANPEVAQQIQEVTRSAHEKRSGGAPAAAATPAAAAAPKAPSLDAMPEEVRQIVDERRQKSLDDKITAAVQSQPLFAANPRLAERAVQKLRAVASAVPDASLEAVAAAYANEVEAITAETLPDSRKVDRERFGSTVKPGATAPAQQGPAVVYTYADMESGRVRDAVKEWLEKNL